MAQAAFSGRLPVRRWPAGRLLEGNGGEGESETYDLFRQALRISTQMG